MSIFRRERPIESREQLAAYIHKEKGMVKARLYATGDETEVYQASGGMYTEVEEVRVSRLALRSKDAEGQEFIGFLPFGRGIGEAEGDCWGFDLEPGEQLALNGARFVVMSRHEIPASQLAQAPATDSAVTSNR